MKKTVNVLCTLALMSALCAGCRGGDAPTPEPPVPAPVPKEPQEVSHYYRGSQKIELKVRKDLVVVKASSSSEAKTLSELDIFASEDFPGHTVNFWLFAVIDPEKTTIEDVRKLPGVLSAAYGMENDDEYPCWTMDEILVRPAQGTSIGSVIKEAGLSEYVGKTELFLDYVDVNVITLNMNIEHIMWASCELFETGMCEWAEPNIYGGAGVD